MQLSMLCQSSTLTLDLIKQLIRIHKPQSILEIGTAIGYSSMQFASVDSNIHITTIERNDDMFPTSPTQC